MKQPIHYILEKNILKKTLKICPLIVLTLSCLGKEHARGDSTFFPENSAEATANKTDKENSDAIKEWAELSPPKEAEPQKKDIAPLHAQTPEEPEKQKEELISIAVVPDSKTPAPDSNTPLAAQEKGPLPPPSLASEPKAPLSAEIQQPLQPTTVTPHPKALPVHEKNTASSSSAPSQKTVVSYSDAAHDRSPLGILDPAQEVHNQRWYIYSSAIRGLKNPSDSVHIVCMNGTPPNRGEEVKNLLVEMGIESEKIHLIHAKGDENQEKIIYIFAGK